MWSLSATDTTKDVLLPSVFRRQTFDPLILYSKREILIQKALAVSASTASIALCVSAIYMFMAIDPRRLVFRHQLIAFLIFFDLVKAVVLLIFPARVMTDGASIVSNQFCQVIGFFTATATEGADLAILAFAIHTVLLIFKPSLNVKVKRSGRVEGGLYKYRSYVYGLSFVIPVAMASFPYIGKGYHSFVCWCYLPHKPFWYREGLSWIPRYVIVVVIFGVYLSIYIHVLKEFRLLGGTFTQLHHRKTRDTQNTVSESNPSFFSALMFSMSGIRTFFFSSKSSAHEGFSSSSSNVPSSNIPGPNISGSNEPKIDSPGGPLDLENGGNTHFHFANLEGFQKRQRAIEKQMKSIFIYPVAYVSIWLFPFILHCTQFYYEDRNAPIVWLHYLGAFMQPFIGFVDSLVFFYREQPWKYTIMKNFEKENKGRLDLVFAPGSSSTDMESTTTSTKYDRSLSALSMRVDFSQYSRFRRFMSKCRFPFMKLPSEKNIAKFQAKYLCQQIKIMRAAGPPGPPGSPGPAAPTEADAENVAKSKKNIGELQAKHDFSNLLDGGNSATDFRSRLDSFSFGPLDSGRKGSSQSATLSSSDRRQSVVSISNKSVRGVSVFEGQDPIREHTGTYRKSILKGSKLAVNKVGSNDNEEKIDFMDFLGREP